MNDLMHQLRPLRPRLVRAAEAVFDGPQEQDKKLKSQLNHLIAVCNAASCHEEIRLYLHYQASREHAPLPTPISEQIVAGIEGIFDSADPPITDVEQQIGAWRLYAVYLARAFTYAYKSSDPGPRDRSRDVSRANSQPPRGRR